MAIIWHIPRKKYVSSEPRVIISKRFIGINTACIKAHFLNIFYVKVGYDPEVKKLYVCPVNKGDNNAMKIIINKKSSHRYINASKIFKKFAVGEGEYKFNWDTGENCLVVDIQNDKVDKLK